MKQLTTKYTKYTNAKGPDMLRAILRNWSLPIRSTSNPPSGVFVFVSFVSFVVTKS